jgi:hypothetical protein
MDKTQTTQTMRDPKRWAVFTWFADNGLPPPVESEITDLLESIEMASDSAKELDAAWAKGYQEALNDRI